MPCLRFEGKALCIFCVCDFGVTSTKHCSERPFVVLLRCATGLYLSNPDPTQSQPMIHQHANPTHIAARRTQQKHNRIPDLIHLRHPPIRTQRLRQLLCPGRLGVLSLVHGRSHPRRTNAVDPDPPRSDVCGHLLGEPGCGVFADGVGAFARDGAVGEGGGDVYYASAGEFTGDWGW